MSAQIPEFSRRNAFLQAVCLPQRSLYMTRFMLIAVFVLGGSAYAADPAADELKKLQGEWQVVGAETKGKKVEKDDPDAKSMRFVIKDNDLTVMAAGGGE